MFDLLKKQEENKKFEFTQEAMISFEKIKDFLKQETMLYNFDFDEPLYLSTDASNVGMGSFLYQIKLYEKTPEGKKAMLKELGYEPEEGLGHFLIPGVSPGRQTPVVTDFLKNKEDLEKYDKEKTILSTETMTEKIDRLKDKIVHVRPIAWHSKCFTTGQIQKYQSMEKEFFSLLHSIINFRDYIECSKITYVITDSQPVL